jgi:pilus assembly protein CpaB
MRIIAVLVLVFGVALAGGALFFASEYFKQVRASMAQSGPETVRVLVAKQELSYGQRLLPKHLQWVEWPKAAVPPGSFTDVKFLLGAQG